MKKMIAIVDSQGATKSITVTRIVRFEVEDERRCWFDLAFTTELEAFVRVAGARDEEPWRSFAFVPFGSRVHVGEVTMPRDDAPAVAPSPQELSDDAAREARVRMMAERRAKLEQEGIDAEEQEKDRIEKGEARTGKIFGVCRRCNKKRDWKHDQDGNVVMKREAPCPAPNSQGLPCRRRPPWEQATMLDGDAGNVVAASAMHDSDGEG